MAEWTGEDHRGRYRVDTDSIERESWGGYKSVSSPDSWSNYETLVAPDGTEVATLGEPEDRTFSRDLSPLIERLAAAEQRAAEVTKERDRALARAEEVEADAAQIHRYQARAVAAEAKAEERFDCRRGPGWTSEEPACGACVTCLTLALEISEASSREATARAEAAERDSKEWRGSYARTCAEVKEEHTARLAAESALREATARADEARKAMERLHRQAEANLKTMAVEIGRVADARRETWKWVRDYAAAYVARALAPVGAWPGTGGERGTETPQKIVHPPEWWAARARRENAGEVGAGVPATCRTHVWVDAPDGKVRCCDCGVERPGASPRAHGGEET